MALPNGFFDADTVSGSARDDQPVEDHFPDLRSPFTTDSTDDIVLGSRFNDTQSDELAAINASNPKLGIQDVAGLLNGRLSELCEQVDNSQDSLRELLVQLVESPDQAAQNEFLSTIEEFVETSKYALVTFEMLQRKVNRLFNQGSNAINPELTAMHSDLTRILQARLEERKVKHDEFVKLIGTAAQTDEQLIALVAKVHADLGVKADSDFSELWAENAKKVFVTLPENHLEFLKRFEAVLETSIGETKKNGIFGNTDQSAVPLEFEYKPYKPDGLGVSLARLSGRASKMKTRIDDAIGAGLKL
jgi:hypothetical protein